METRGIRNNNPLNIRHSKDKWQGMVTTQTDGSFVQFTTMAYGYRAAWKVLETYWNRFRKQKELFNVKNIIGRWAPPTENDTQNYIRTVLKMSGLGGNETLPQPSRGQCYHRLELLVRAMTAMECGIPYKDVDREAILEGFDLAFPGVLKSKKKRMAVKGPADFGASLPPDTKETTFCCWDEYWDW